MDSESGPQKTIMLNSVVELRRVFVATQLSIKVFEAVRDCKTSVSCLSLVNFEDLRKTIGIEVQKCNKIFKAANVPPTGVKGIIRFRFEVVNKQYKQELQVLENTE